MPVLDSACQMFLSDLRACARRRGVAPAPDESWFAKLTRARLARAPSRAVAKAERDASCRSIDAQASRLIASAARRAAAAGAVSSAGALVGELATLVSDGLAGPISVPAIAGSVVGNAIFTATNNIDLVCDLASLYGVPFDTGDEGELAAVFDLAFPSGKLAARTSRPRDAELAVRVGAALLEDAAMGLVPLVGVPFGGARQYATTRRLGKKALDYVRHRAGVRAALAPILERPIVDAVLLLEGAWLLSTADDTATHEELVILSLIAGALPGDHRSLLERVHGTDEELWIFRMAALEHDRCAAVLDALHLIAALRGPTEEPERRFLERTAHALDARIEWRRIKRMHERVAQRAPSAPYFAL